MVDGALWWLALFTTVAATFAFPLGDVYKRSALLDPDNRIVAYWKDDGTDITFEVHAATKGWVGLGFSSNGGMIGADMVVGGVRNGQGYLYDRYSEANGFPRMDADQNYRLLAAAENATHTMLRFSRALDTCDSAEDRILNKDTVHLIWALHEQDARNPQEIPKHVGHRDRGAKSVLLLDEPYDESSLPPSARPIDLRAEAVRIPSDTDTLYWCSIHKLPLNMGKQQMLRFGPIIQPGNEPYVHHAVIYHCMEDMEDLVGQGAPCFLFDDASYKNPMRSCQSRFMAAWAVGGGDVTFPADMGFPLLEEGSSPYFMLEMHYDNPQLVPNIVDSSGMRLWLSPEQRPVEVGNIIFGMGVGVEDFFIPPGQEKFTYYSVCTANCTGQIPPEGIKLFTIFPHEHLTGRGLRLRHIRNGVELPPIFSDDHYDFNYQEQRLINPNPTILPGDVLITECDFDTRKRNETTFSSFSSRDEMCLFLANFYPKKADSMLHCMGGPVPDDFLEMMGAEKVEKEEARNGEPLVNGPLGKRLPYTQYVNRFFRRSDPAFEQRLRSLNDVIQTGKYFEVCGGRDNSDINDAVAEEHRRLKREGREKLERMKWKFSTMEGLVKPERPYHPPPSNCPRREFQPGSQRRSSQPAHLSDVTVTSGLDPNYRPGDEAYDHSAWLDDAGRVHLAWLLSNDRQRITFELTAAARGWAGVGISPNGGMRGADMIMAWMDPSGQPQLSDRHGDANAYPPPDARQDYRLIGGTRNATHMVFKFSRALETCDEEDAPIGNDTARMIWALSDVVPRNGDFRVHSPRDRGSRSVYLTDVPLAPSAQLQSDLASPDVMVMELKSNRVQLPSDYHTLYWCQIFEMPEKDPHHLIKYEPIIQPGSEPYVHHMILYSCEKKLDMSEYVGKGEPCFDAQDRRSQNFSPMYQCTSQFLAGWAVGGTSHAFPDDVGYPFFTPEQGRYLMLEMHYDNSALDRNVVDSSGLRLHLTPHLRPIDAGIFVVGAGVSPQAIVIPPGQENFTQYAYCPGECFNSVPPTGVNVFGGILHSHLAGRAMRVRHIRRNQELPPLMEDNAYDFNYQELHVKPKPVTVLPGDSFVTECIYNSQARRRTSFGGFATQDEMCLGFFEYWPRVKDLSTFCLSSVDGPEMFRALGAPANATVAKGKVDGVPVIDWVRQEVESNDGWDANKFGPERWAGVRRLQETVKEGRHYAVCMSPEAKDAAMDEEAAHEGIHNRERPGVRRREAKKAMKFAVKAVDPRRDFDYRRYQPPSACSNRRYAPQRREGNGASGVTALSLVLLLLPSLLAL